MLQIRPSLPSCEARWSGVPILGSITFALAWLARMDGGCLWPRTINPEADSMSEAGSMKVIKGSAAKVVHRMPTIMIILPTCGPWYISWCQSCLHSRPEDGMEMSRSVTERQRPHVPRTSRVGA